MATNPRPFIAGFVDEDNPSIAKIVEPGIAAAIVNGHSKLLGSYLGMTDEELQPTTTTTTTPSSSLGTVVSTKVHPELGMAVDFIKVNDDLESVGKALAEVVANLEAGLPDLQKLATLLEEERTSIEKQMTGLQENLQLSHSLQEKSAIIEKLYANLQLKAKNDAMEKTIVTTTIYIQNLTNMWKWKLLHEK